MLPGHGGAAKYKYMPYKIKCRPSPDSEENNSIVTLKAVTEVEHHLVLELLYPSFSIKNCLSYLFLGWIMEDMYLRIMYPKEKIKKASLGNLYED
jgi:hypothetical protein